MTGAPAAPSRNGPGLVAALVGGLLLGWATPPAAAPLAEWLVVPGLMAWFALASGGRRPLLHSYLFGCVHMAWFSWSVRHVLLPAYVAIVVVGGLYYLLGSVVVRRATSAWRPAAFAVAVGGTCWLRASMPEIHYPHGQPAHCLWQYPMLMRGLVIGGEPLANALLALFAAAGVEMYRCWRVGVPDGRYARRGLGIALGAMMATVGLGNTVMIGFGRDHVTGAAGRSVRVAAVEPGFHPFDERPYGALLQQRLFAPTRDLLQRPDPPDLILWPESVLPETLRAVDVAAGRVRLLAGLLPAAPGTRLVLGAHVVLPGGDPDRPRPTPSALLVEPGSGLVLDHHDKQRLVPGGEFLPFFDLLPDGVAASLREAFAAALGSAPDCLPGAPRPPLETAAGVPFGALLCYDNAFPGPARELVDAGAELLVVLSNEAWYRGGGELTQLVAMTVVRAIETGAPVVRCTLDGRSVAVDAGGRVVDELDLVPAPAAKPRILEVSLDRGPGQLPPLAWTRRLAGPALGLLVALAAAHTLYRRVRIRTARTAPSAAAGSGPSGGSRGGS